MKVVYPSSWSARRRVAALLAVGLVAACAGADDGAGAPASPVDDAVAGSDAGETDRVASTDDAPQEPEVSESADGEATDPEVTDGEVDDAVDEPGGTSTTEPGLQVELTQSGPPPNRPECVDTIVPAFPDFTPEVGPDGAIEAETEFGTVEVPAGPEAALGMYTTDVDTLIWLRVPLADLQPNGPGPTPDIRATSRRRLPTVGRAKNSVRRPPAKRWRTSTTS